jgi:hypothetical protein
MRNKKSPSHELNGLKHDNPPKTVNNSTIVDDQVQQQKDSEIELQEKSLALRKILAADNSRKVYQFFK